MKTRLSALQLEQREVPAWFGFMVDLPNPPPPGGTPPASSTPAVEIVELDGVAIVNAPDAAAATLLVNTALATLPTPGNTSVSPTGGNLLTPGGPACWISAPIPIEMPPLPDVNLGDSGTGLGPPTPAAPVGPLLGYFPLPTLPGGQPVKMPKPQPGDDTFKVKPIFKPGSNGGNAWIGVDVTVKPDPVTANWNVQQLLAPSDPKLNWSMKVGGELTFNLIPENGIAVYIGGSWTNTPVGQDKWDYYFGLRLRY